MLPGFRFLFAAIILSMSILVFGLGAAALLRTAHEEFAANPTWRAAPEPVFAQQSETSKATIAMLRVNPPLPEPKPALTTTAFAPIEPASSVSPQADKAPAPDSPAPTEAKPEIRADIKQDGSTDTPPAQAAAAAQPAEAAPSQAPADTAAIKVATTEAPAPAETSEAPPATTGVTTPAATNDTAAPAKTETAMADASETPPGAPATPLQATTASDPIAEKIASVGDTTVKGDEPDAAKAAKAEQRARLRAERARARRRLAAQRARLARQQAAAMITPPFPLQPPATDPFAQQQQQPATTPTPRIRHAAQTP